MTSSREWESRIQEVGIRTRAPLMKTIGGIALAAMLLSPGRAAADPVTFSGGLTGRHNVETLEIAFPDFAVFLDGVTHLMPNFGDAGNGMPVPFTQSTGSFSGHSTGDIDVVGTLSFVGPTDTLMIGQDQGAAATLQEAVTLSGFLKVTSSVRCCSTERSSAAAPELSPLKTGSFRPTRAWTNTRTPSARRPRRSRRPS